MGGMSAANIAACGSYRTIRCASKGFITVGSCHVSFQICRSLFNERRSLLNEVNQQSRQMEELARSRQLGDQQQQAFAMLTSGKVSRAFELDREPATVRDRYGRHQFGQSLLLSRRLLEAGVPIVQANMGHVQNWDSHGDIFNRLDNPG